MVSLDSKTKQTTTKQQSSPVEEVLGLEDQFVNRHVDPTSEEIDQMLKALGFSSLDALIDETVPSSIRLQKELDLPKQKSEYEALKQLRAIASDNQVFRSFIGMGYYDCITPAAIQRNILENPGWYTAYTPYQPEIAQGRLEALLNFQTMISDLTGLEIANSSLLDEATAAAEAMSMSVGVSKSKATAFFVSEECHPQTIEVLQTRAQPLGLEVIVGNHREFDFSTPIFGALLQYPTTEGKICDYREFVEKAHEQKALVTVAADPLSLALLTPPGEWGADIAVGSTQRFGVPLGYGGPHAAYFATKEKYKRQLPGRLVGVSKDTQGKPALRLALQTREQHIRRDRATSNICTAQVLLAVIASMYGVYHGPGGIKRIAEKVHRLTVTLAEGLKRIGYTIASEPYFDTLKIETNNAPQTQQAILQAAEEQQINLRSYADGALGVSLDEATTVEEVKILLQLFAGTETLPFSLEELVPELTFEFPETFNRTSSYLTEAVFNRYHSETKLVRYLNHLQSKDLSLTTSMIPLGSCTMKLNAAAEMYPVTWAEFGKIHPFAPKSQTKGYQTLFEQLETWLSEITGFADISLQPNAGAQGEYTGLLVIRQYHQTRGEGHRNICLIPESAHGTNPASAVMCGMKVVPIQCNERGDIDLDDLRTKAEKHSENLAALMVTYPSTHGVFETEIQTICETVHQHGGQVYLDGANMNAQLGLCRPGDYGADVCHLNLHKTFCIPHGGGGPGMGPIGVQDHLKPFLPRHPVIETGGEQAIGAVAAAPWGSPSILPISWMFIAMMGAKGLTHASKVAILNANYMAHRLDEHYPVLYKGNADLVAHECIIDLRLVKKSANIGVDDIAKRLMDFGFHAPTVSWPVAGTMMIEPTESESKEELDRFCDAMIAIRKEISAIEMGEVDPENNVLKNAPHTHEMVIGDDWQRPYSREKAAYPSDWLRDYKFWPSVGRIDNAFGDRNLVCSCVGMEAYTE
ncbi:glycine dehydrogenase (decarboxylating) beta subunit [Halothece sp. PCC 7418]|uniref:aminomethyl-transferring glycine dehydrogenase n=1 Tax=Halothece sp. (strain PCC 7418) TaxID=65093 RepID=UPI0002A05F34|nr:aminomethyl-transferring glycine dehydrogenase [Halothece sp. PCC 7418]AFZ43578.1 glycine dehydrogenase (decarboxylating) beta subunit [Halothece sp. PCC 7418]